MIIACRSIKRKMAECLSIFLVSTSASRVPSVRIITDDPRGAEPSWILATIPICDANIKNYLAAPAPLMSLTYRIEE